MTAKVAGAGRRSNSRCVAHDGPVLGSRHWRVPRCLAQSAMPRRTQAYRLRAIEPGTPLDAERRPFELLGRRRFTRMLLELNDAIMVAVVCVLVFVFIMLRFG